MDKLEMLKMFASANKDAATSSKPSAPAEPDSEESEEGCGCDCEACKNCLHK